MSGNYVNHFLTTPGSDGVPPGGQFAGMAIKKAVDESKQVGDKTWFLGIPIQMGPGSPKSKNLTHWMHFILVVQAVSCGMKILILKEFVGAMWMMCVIVVGYYAMHQDMNITLTCLWGVLCLLNGVFCLIALVLPMVVGLVKMEVLRLVATILVPASYLLGAIFAVHLYQVSADQDNVQTPLDRFGDRFPVRRIAEPVGQFFDDTDPYKTSPAELSGRALEGFRASEKASHAERSALRQQKQVCYGVC